MADHRDDREGAEAEISARARAIVENHGGIYPPFEAFYIQSIIYSASRATDSFQRFRLGRAVGDTEANQVSAVHETLGHAAALSRYFWPSGGSRRPGEIVPLRASRAAKLRAAFELRDTSPLKGRRLRDALEHFDERLDVYLLNHPSGYFFPSPRIGDASLADESEGHLFKLVDPESMSFVCLGEVFHFGPLVDEVNRIHDRALQMERDGARLR